MKNVKKFTSMCYKVGMKVLPFCAMAMAVMSVNATACWVNGQPAVPESLKKYRNF